MEAVDGEGPLGNHVGGLVELRLLVLLGAERLDHPHSGEALLEHGGHAARVSLDLRPHDAEPAADPHGDGRRQGHGAEAQEAELPVGGQEQPGNGPQEHEDVHRVDEPEADEPADALHVGRGPGHHVAGPLPVVEAKAEGLETQEEGVSQIEGHALGDVLGKVALAVAEPAPHQGHRQHQRRPHHQVAGPAPLQRRVDGDAQEPWDGQRQEG